MKKFIKAFYVMLFIFMMLSSTAPDAVSKTAPVGLSLRRAHAASVPFIENRGQVADSKVKYYVDTFGYRVSVAAGWRLIYGAAGSKKGRKDQSRLQEHPVGAAVRRMTAKDKAPTRVNIYAGRDRRKWLKDLPTYRRIEMGEIYPGIRMTLAARGSTVEKLFHLQPYADAKLIRMQVDGGDKLSITKSGELKIDTPNGLLSFTAPVAYQTIDGRKVAVDVAYHVSGSTYGFTLSKYDPARALVIDPLINSYFITAGSGRSEGRCMAVDGQGNLYVAGHFDETYGIWKFDPRAETLLESTYFGVHYSNYNLWDIAVDSRGNVLVGGSIETFHADEFPIPENAFDREFLGGSEGFVAKFDPEFNLTAATFIGGQGDDEVNAIAVDQNDEIYIAATVEQRNNAQPEVDLLPTGYDTTLGDYGADKLAILKLDGRLEHLLASTLLGGNSESNYAAGIAIDGEGNIVAAGDTEDSNFPLSPGAADTTFAGPSEGFISKFDPTLTHLLASTFIGGIDAEWVTAIIVDTDNNIFVGGRTESMDFPVTEDSFDTRHNIGVDGFVAKLSSDLRRIAGAAYIGGSQFDVVWDLSLQNDGGIALAGITESPDFPTTPMAHDPTHNTGYDNRDGFVAIADGTLRTLQESTFLGGTFEDSIYAILRNNDNLYVSGSTFSNDFPFITEAYKHNGYNLFVSRFNPNEEPQAPDDPAVPSPVLAGHWQSPDNLTTLSAIAYLNVDICSNGDFSGFGGTYTCVPAAGVMLQCNWESDSYGELVSGRIDFSKDEGTIAYETSPDLTFTITSKSVDKIVLQLHTSDAWNLNRDISAELHFQGEGGRDEGNGGGGCFMTSLGIFK